MAVTGAEAAQNFFSEEELARAGDVALSAFSQEQKYLFDLNGVSSAFVFKGEICIIIDMYQSL